MESLNNTQWKKRIKIKMKFNLTPILIISIAINILCIFYIVKKDSYINTNTMQLENEISLLLEKNKENLIKLEDLHNDIKLYNIQKDSIITLNKKIELNNKKEKTKLYEKIKSYNNMSNDSIYKLFHSNSRFN